MKVLHVTLGVNSKGIVKCLCGATWKNGEERTCKTRGVKVRGR